MSNFQSLASLAAAATFLPSVIGTFDASSNSNVAVYWGQGPNQKPLSHFCADPNIDIINVAFLNKSPEGTNVGNQCGNVTLKNKDGSASPLLSDCPSIGPDIVTCQKAGKKVFLSLGGAIPSDQTVKDDESAQSFADFLWTSFGPKTDDTTVPRPFGDAVIDGFNFDIESQLENAADESKGYGSLINNLRSYTSFSNTERTFYISGAPQCVVPDAHLADAIKTSWFDFLFVQFYNTKECSARSYFDHSYGGENTNISLSAWIDFVHTHGLNKHSKVFLGLPAAESAVIDAAMYLQPNEAKEIIQAFQSEYPNDLGGVMVYEATYSETNSINGVPYADIVKKHLEEGGSSDQQSLSSSALGTQATAFTNSFPSEIPSTLPPGLAPPSSSAPYPMSSSSAPYPIPSGSAPSGHAGSSGVVPSGSVLSKSGTAPHTSKTGTAPYQTGTVPHTVNSGTAPYPTKTGTAPSNSATIVPSGPLGGFLPSGSASSSVPYPIASASSGFLPSGSASSNVPYPINNSTTHISTGGQSSPSSTSGEQVVTYTSVVTITSCGPQVTNCPAKTHPVVSTQTFVSTIHSGSVPAGGVSSASSSAENSPQSSHEVASSPSVPAGGASVTSSPNSSPQSTQEVVTTEMVTSYLTTCPVTHTATSGGSQVIETGSTVSTVYSTITSTICTKCVAPPTSASVPGSGPSGPSGPSSTSIVGIPGSGHQGPAPMPKPSSSVPVTQTNSPSNSAVVPSAPTQEVVTTAIVYTTLTTCPVTNTITSGTSEIVQVKQTVSTITNTVISTICTKCVAPQTSVPVPASSPSGPSSTDVISMPGSFGHQGPPLPMAPAPQPGKSSPNNPLPNNSSPGNSSPGSSPQGASTFEQHLPAASSQAGPSSPASSSPSPQIQSGAQGSNVPANSGNTDSSPAPNSPESPVIPNNNSPPTNNIPASPNSQSGAQPQSNNQAAAPAGPSSPESSSPSSQIQSGAHGAIPPSNTGNTGSENPVGPNNSPSTPQSPNSPVPVSSNSPSTNESPAQPEFQSGAQPQPQTNSQPAAPIAAASSPAVSSPAASGPQTIQSTINIVPVQTLTIVPIPVSPTQTAKPNQPIVQSGAETNVSPSNSASIPGAETPAGNNVPPSNAASNSGAETPAGNNSPAPAPAPVASPAESNSPAGVGAPAPFPVDNGVTSATPSDTSSPASAASPAESNPQAGVAAPAPFPLGNGTTPASPSGTSSPSGSVGPSVQAFQGAAGRLSAGVYGILAVMAVVIMV